MYTIHLQQLRFTGFHGLYPYEKKLGNEFEVNVRIQVDENIPPSHSDIPLVDYTEAFALIRTCMLTPTPLLEELARTIASQLLQHFPAAQQIHLSLFKLHPPIPHFQGKVGVEFDIDRHQIK
jgi:7,8-dihydroneopterin aldolase/epimerase/oxygenase